MEKPATLWGRRCLCSSELLSMKARKVIEVQNPFAYVEKFARQASLPGKRMERKPHLRAEKLANALDGPGVYAVASSKKNGDIVRRRFPAHLLLGNHLQCVVPNIIYDCGIDILQCHGHTHIFVVRAEGLPERSMHQGSGFCPAIPHKIVCCPHVEHTIVAP